MKSVKGNDKEEYMMSAARENGHQLEDRFGQVLWKVALEPEYRMDIDSYTDIAYIPQ